MTKTVWHLCSNRWNSAITEYALRSAQSLQLVGWKSVLSAKPSSHCERRAEEYSVKGPSFEFKVKDLFALRDARRVIQPDLIVTYGGPETFLARFLGVPVVRFRGQDSDLTDEISPLAARLNLGFCRAILTPAKKVQLRFQNALRRVPVFSVVLGLDASIFKARPRITKRPVLMIVGRLDPIKGHAEFLRIYRDLLEVWPEHKPKPYLEIIGQKSNVSPDSLHELAQNLKLARGEDYEIIDQRVQDLPERMANATLGLIPSLGSEVIARVTEEFLLSGTPVLVSAVGTLEECLIDGSFGSVLNHASLFDWTSKSYKETDEERLKRSDKAKEYFSLEAMGTQLAKIYESLIDSKY